MTEFDHQLMAYYGIHYLIEHVKDVLAVVARDPKYRDLDRDDGEIMVDRDQHILVTTNSDRKVGASYGCIFVDEMTIQGDPVDDPEQSFVDIEPSVMVKSETDHIAAAHFVTDLYELIIRELKKKKIKTNEFHLGWRVVSCTFDDDETGSGSDDTPDTRSDSDSHTPPMPESKPVKATSIKAPSKGVLKAAQVKSSPQLRGSGGAETVKKANSKTIEKK